MSRHAPAFFLAALLLAGEGRAVELSTAALADLGWAQRDADIPEGGYPAFPARKKPGAFRVGVFGCSLVWGHEAARGQDLPSFLRRKFAAEGYGGVEVLNFGVGAYGFHQAFLLWRALAAAYGLDYVAAYWMPEYARRDETFMFHDYEPRAVPHARFVLDGPGVRLVEPAGSAYDERVRSYHALFPPWRYWRYDARAPLLLRRWSPLTRSSWWNPFYYLSRAAADEEAELTRRLVSLMAAAGKPVALFSDEARAEDVAALEGAARGTGASWTVLPRGRRQVMLHNAPLMHPSALGNQARADSLFAYLTGRAVASPLLRLEPLPEPVRSAPLPPLREWSDGRLYARGRPIARLVRAGAPPRRDLEPATPQDLGLESLLAFWSEDELVFLPWPRAWDARSAAEARDASGAWRRVGEVVSGDGRLGLLRLEHDAPGPLSGAMRVGGILLGKDAPLLRLRACAGDYADPRALPPAGPACFASRDGARRAAAALFRVSAVQVRLPAPAAVIYRK